MNKNTFKIEDWQEQNLSEDHPCKVTQATVKKIWQGSIIGTGHLIYLMSYNLDQTVTFTGLERIEAEIEGKKGRLVLIHKGVFKEGVARAEFSIIKDSVTDELTGLTGTGSYHAGHSELHPYTFEYQLT